MQSIFPKKISQLTRYKLKNIFIFILKIFDLQLIDIKKNSPRHIKEEDDWAPVEIQYLLGKNPVVLFVDIEKGRGLPVYSFGCGGQHPFSVAVKMAKHKNIKQQYNEIEKVLKFFYKTVAPKTSAEVFQFKTDSLLGRHPSWAVVMPWDSENVVEWKQFITKAVHHENLRENSSEGIEGGWAWLGPVSIKKLHIETSRTVQILQSIQARGYQRLDSLDGDIVVNILVNDDNDWVWQSIGAQHRVSVLSGLGREKVQVRVKKIIRRQDIEYWPNVVNGTYTKEEARKLFDVVFEGDYSFMNSEWSRYVDTLDLSYE